LDAGSKVVFQKGNTYIEDKSGRLNVVRGSPWEPIPGREDIELKSRVIVPADRIVLTQVI